MLMCVKDLNKKGAGPSGVRMHSAYLPFLRTLSVTLSLSSLFLGQFRTNIYNAQDPRMMGAPTFGRRMLISPTHRPRAPYQ